MAQLSSAPSGWQRIATAVGPRPAGLSPDIDWVAGPAGRGRQLNHGVACSQSNWLWFIHADCRLLPGVIEAVSEFIEKGQEALGWLRLRFAADGPALTRLNALGAYLRSRYLKLPYGDQGLLIPRRWFDNHGGFDETLRRGEDLDLVVRLRQAGLPIRPIGATVETSARRYREIGWLATTLAHQRAAWQLARRARRKS